MADYTLTPNLGLRVAYDISTIDKYNLLRIDELAGRISISSSGITTLSALSDVYITAKSGRGITNVDGKVFIRAGNLLSGDTLSSINLYARNFNLIGKTDNPDESAPSSILFNVDSVDFNGATISGFSSSEMAEHLSTYNHSAIALNTAARHTHGNISVLNSTQEAFTTTLKAQYDAAVAAGGFTQVHKSLTSDDISNGYVTLPSTPAVPGDTICMPQEAPTQYYGELQDYTVSENKLYFGTATINSMGIALEEGDNISILYR